MGLWFRQHHFLGSSIFLSDWLTTVKSAQVSRSKSENAWHLIPAFRPGETDVNEYTRRLEFL